MRYGSTTKVLAKFMLKYCRISKWLGKLSWLLTSVVYGVQCKQVKAKKALRVVDFMAMLQTEFQVPLASQRLWLWAKRQNGTTRPSRVITPGMSCYPCIALDAFRRCLL